MSNMPMPSYNPEWSKQPAVAAPVKPKQVGWAFQLILAAALLQVVAAIFGIVYATSDSFRATAHAAIEKQHLPNTTGRDLVSVTVATTIGFLIVSAVVAVVVYIIIALFINKGAGWARITGLVLAVVSLSQLFGLHMPAGIFSILQVLAGIAAIVLCFIKPGSLFFTDMKNFKQANKFR
ncbi:hypothetical protein [Arthrobacter sp. STN4]|uniref:hypothetical protein n=1 Tax=Arthrobacter sp. STN4 TaxID=2923276 RepID=UPI002119EE8B|nr:hypothetical protein [Arthrobacter sp. STN4]MCQ9163266.1 hypothetical protein [Arthrobacter sp. STN4]